MLSHRAMKDQARRDLHSHAQVPALYVSPAPGVEPRLISVRLHHKPEMIGGLTGDKAWANKSEIKVTVVVLREQLTNPPNGGIFSFAQGEAYRINKTDKPDGITVTCHVTKIADADTADLPYPLPDASQQPPTIDPGEGGVGIGERNRIKIPFPVAQSDWTYEHNLGYYPEVLTLGPDGEEIEGRVAHISVNLVSISFKPSTSGTLILI